MRLAAYWGDVSDTVANVAARATYLYGGATVYNTQGYWADDDGNLVREPAYVVEVFTDDTVAARDNWERLNGSELLSTDESAVLVTFDSQTKLLRNNG